MHSPSFGQTDTAESGSFLPSAACFFILAALRLSPWCGDQLSSQAVPQRAARWRHPLYLSHLPIHWIYRRHAKSRTEYSFYYGLLFLFLSLYRRTATTSLFTRDCHNGILSSLFLSLGESHRRSLHCLSICHVCKYFASESMLRLEMTAEDSSPYWDINMHYLLLLHWLTKTWPLRVRPSSLPPYPVLPMAPSLPMCWDTETQICCAFDWWLLRRDFLQRYGEQCTTMIVIAQEEDFTSFKKISHVATHVYVYHVVCAPGEVRTPGIPHWSLSFLFSFWWLMKLNSLCAFLRHEIFQLSENLLAI